MKIVIIYTEFADFIFKTTKDLNEENIKDENGNLNDEIINFLIDTYNLDADTYSDLKTDVFEIICKDIDTIKEF